MKQELTIFDNPSKTTEELKQDDAPRRTGFGAKMNDFIEGYINRGLVDSDEHYPVISYENKDSAYKLLRKLNNFADLERRKTKDRLKTVRLSSNFYFTSHMVKEDELWVVYVALFTVDPLAKKKKKDKVKG